MRAGGVGVLLGTTQEECKVLMISGLSGVLADEVPEPPEEEEEEGDRVSLRSSRLGGGP